MSEHVILVAFHVTGPDREAAERALLANLPRPGVLNPYFDSTRLEEWWVAEDDRRDGSDNDSAVFVSPGNQQRAFEVLHAEGLTPDVNDPRMTYFYEHVLRAEPPEQEE